LALRAVLLSMEDESTRMGMQTSGMTRRVFITLHLSALRPSD